MRDIIKTALILTAICIVVTGALATTYFFTKSIIEQRTASDEAAIRATIIKADKYELITDTARLKIVFGDKYAGIVSVYKAFKADGSDVGMIITATSRGYSGPIQVVTGFDNNNAITVTKISQITETPGLGMKALDAKFLSQFSGFLPKSALKTVKTPKTAPEQIEAISGATITSDAVVKAVNLSFDLAVELNKAKLFRGTTP